MKIKLLISSLFLIAFTKLMYSQSFKFNLKNLDNLSVEINDGQGFLSSTTHQKLITEIKLKLLSTGMKVTSPEEAEAKMFVIVNAIKSKIAAHRILVHLNIYENVETQRVDAIDTGAITYSDYTFFKDKNIEQAVYDKIMDTMIINFIENYLGQK